MCADKTVRFKLLGSFSCGNGEKGAWEQKSASGRKALSVLQYLLMNHTRPVSAEELIGVFWSERSTNPINALRVMFVKIRRYLKEMFPEQESVIVTLRGCYTFNPALRIVLDSEEFEQACMEARKQPGEAAAEALSGALSLYKGDFLAGNDCDWVLSTRRYYQTLYLDACRAVLPHLQKQERWMEIVSVCALAQNIDFAAEDFVSFRMQALISLNQPAQVVDEYKQFRERLWEEFQVAPTEHVEWIYALALGMGRQKWESEDILKMMEAEESDRSAFLCNFEIFRKIVALEKRHLDRSGGVSSVVIVSLGNRVVPATDANRLEKILLKCLRKEDPVSRLDEKSYLLMLTESTPEDAELVMERISRAFRRAYPSSGACISFRIASLEAKGKKYMVNS